MKYWNQILENLSKDQRNEKFQIILNGTTYEIPLSYALGISSLITEKYFNDPSFHELKIKINEDNQMGDKEIQNEFQKFIHGEEISNEFYFAIGSSLENKEMIQNWSQNQTKTTKTIMNMINANHKINNQGIENIKELLSYLPDHLEELKENLNELRNDELIFILKSDKIKVEKEDIIWEIVKERLLKIENSNNQENKSLLLGTIEPKYLRKDYLKEYIEMIDNEDIEREAKLFKKIKQLLIQNIDNIKIKKEIKGKIEKINHEEGQNFQGILYNLQKKYGNNIHDQGIISISASSSQHNRPEQVINYNWNEKWHSDGNPGNWLEINFKQFKVKVDGYSLKTMNSPPDQDCHLKNWIIEGSKNKIDWIEIDREVNNYDLNGANYQHYYPISKELDYFQYVRIRSIGDNHFIFCANYLEFTNIECYGDILSCSE